MTSVLATPYDLPTSVWQLKRSASGIEDLLEQASDHVSAAMQQFEIDQRRHLDERSSSGGVVKAPFTRARRSRSVKTVLVGIFLRLFRIKRLEEPLNHSDEDDDNKYRRLKNGFTALVDHVDTLDKSREELRRVLTSLRESSDELDQISRDAVATSDDPDNKHALDFMHGSYGSALDSLIVCPCLFFLA